MVVGQPRLLALPLPLPRRLRRAGQTNTGGELKKSEKIFFLRSPGSRNNSTSRNKEIQLDKSLVEWLPGEGRPYGPLHGAVGGGEGGAGHLLLLLVPLLPDRLLQAGHGRANQNIQGGFFDWSFLNQAMFQA